MSKTGRSDARTPPVGRKRPYHRWLLEAALIFGALAALHAFQTRDLVSGAAPDFSARLLDGQQVRLSGFRGRPVLLQFWATWCPVCRLEAGSVAEIAREHAVLTVALEDSAPESIRAWLVEHGVEYPVVPDGEGYLASLYGVRGVPTSIIIDPVGNIRFVEVGYTTEWGLRLRLWWAQKYHAGDSPG